MSDPWSTERLAAATEAVAEQLRIANLIAWSQIDEPNGINAKFKTNLHAHEIKEGLKKS